MNAGKVFAGALAVMAAGAVLGILFAPEKGSKTMKKIKDTANDFADEMFDKFNDTLKSAKGEFETVTESAKDLAEGVKSKIDVARH